MTGFRSIEISDPRFEPDGLRLITVKSKHLKGRGDICVYTPAVTRPENALPIVVLLHGVYGSCWSWSMQGGVHQTVARMTQKESLKAMIIAMPSDGLWGDGSAYLPHHGMDFEKWITEDVIAAVRMKIPVAGSGSPLFIGGLSMGGYGALMLAAKYPGLFQGVSVHSAITSLEQLSLFVEEDVKTYKQMSSEKEDVYEAFCARKEALPAIRFDCGSADILLEGNRIFHQQLERKGIPHIYEEYPGGHEWPYWEKHIEKSLHFFSSQLSINKHY